MRDEDIINKPWFDKKYRKLKKEIRVCYTTNALNMVKLKKFLKKLVAKTKCNYEDAILQQTLSSKSKLQQK